MIDRTLASERIETMFELIAEKVQNQGIRKGDTARIWHINGYYSISYSNDLQDDYFWSEPFKTIASLKRAYRF